MNLTIIVPTLTCGGAERVVVTLAAEYKSQGHSVTVITLSSPASDFYSLEDGIKRIGLNVMQKSKGWSGAIVGNLRRIKKLRNAIQSTSPDIVIAHLTETNILTILAMLGTRCPVIVNEHCDPTTLSYGRMWNSLRRIAYPRCSALVSVSQGVENFFSWLPENKKHVVYNPFFVSDGVELTDKLPACIDREKNLLVSMGRLTEQKGFDLLIQSFAKIAPSFPTWQLVILGEGELRSELEGMIKDAGLFDQVVLPGRLNDPFPFLRNADIFVMASRFEGFPMAHGEAMLCGLPVIATDCPSGPSELIRDGVDGILVPNGDGEALIAAMNTLMMDEEFRCRLAAAAPDVAERFKITDISDKWNSIFEIVSGGNA